MYANTFKRRRNAVIATLATLVSASYIALLILKSFATNGDDMVWLGLVTVVVILVVLAMSVYVVKSGKEDFEYTIHVSDAGITIVSYKGKKQKHDQYFIQRPFDMRTNRKNLKVSDGRTTLYLQYTDKMARYIRQFKEAPEPIKVRVLKGGLSEVS